MADEKVTAMTPQTLVDPTDLLHTIDDVAGVPDNLSLTISLLMGGGQNIGRNMVKNSPGQIVTDNAEPQWWADVANAVITDEDAAGEGIEEKTERVFRVVTVADDVYGLQNYSYADEDLMDAGETVLSLGCWVWCDAAATASVAIYGDNLGLQESSQHSGGSSWEWLTVENQTLDGADTDLMIRLIVDTDTAYFTMPTLNVGPVARPWVARGLQYVAIQHADVINSGGLTDIPYSDVDFTATTDNLALMVQVGILFSETGPSGSNVIFAHSDDVVGGDAEIVNEWIGTGNLRFHAANGILFVSDGQVARYFLNEGDADSDITLVARTLGYWRWA